jgi:very-short-patch-repair endonuclease
MRRFLTLAQLRQRGLTRAAIRWGEQQGRWRMVSDGIYAEGPEDVTPFDRAVAVVVATGAAASGTLAGVLLELDAVDFSGPDFTVAPGASGQRPGARRRHLPPERIIEVGGVRCVDGTQALADLAAELDDLRWEQALESALRKGLTTIPELKRAAAGSQPGAARMRRVLAPRPIDAPPTESLLETLMVQLIRTVFGVTDPTRQVVVRDANDSFVARVDLAWPQLGLFIELDGQQHKDQPVYDTNRETAVVAATGWLCGRFTWREVVHVPKSTARRLAAVVEQARRRPVAG